MLHILFLFCKKRVLALAYALLPVLSSLEQTCFLALAWRKFRFVATADYYGLAKNLQRDAFFTNEWTIFQFFVTADYTDVALIGDFTTVAPAPRYKPTHTIPPTTT
jgi:hypothetical protein